MFKLTGILLISIASSQAFTSFYFVIMDYVAAVLCRVNVDFQLKSFLLKPGLPLYQHWICLVHWTRVSILIFLSPLPFSNHWENHHFHTWPIDHHHDHHFNQATNPRRRACRLGNRGETRPNHLPWDGDQDLRASAAKSGSRADKRADKQADHVEQWFVFVFVSNTWVWSCWSRTQF